MQYRLTGRQGTEFVVKILSDDQRTFSLTNVRLGMSFYDIKRFMLEEYNSNARQIQVSRMLRSLRIDTFMQEHQIRSTDAALKRMVDYINRLLPQCPTAFRDNDHRISNLRSAALAKRW